VLETVCNSSSNVCYWDQVEKDHGCKTKSCFGLYADVWFKPCIRENFDDIEVLEHLEKEYFAYKSSFAKNLIFDPNKRNYGKENELDKPYFL